MTALFAAPLGTPKFRAFTAAGLPLAGGKVFTYYAGTTNPTPSYPTYADALAATNANANPVVLDANGEAIIFLPTLPAVNLLYKIRLLDSSNVEQWVIDNCNPAFSYPLPSLTAEWAAETNVYNSVTGTQFTLSGNSSVDVTATYHAGRRIKATPGPLYGTVTSSSFATSQTTVNVVMDSGSLSAGMSIFYGANSYVNPSYLDPRTQFCVTKNGTMTGFGSQTKVTAWTVELDSLSEWDNTNNRWTAKYSGKYLITAAAECSDTGANQTVLLELDNATPTKLASSQNYTHATANNHTTFFCSRVVSIAAGVSVQMMITGSANTSIYGNNSSMISIERIA